MAIPLTELNVAEVPRDGGYLISIVGTFSRSRTYRVYVGPNGDDTDPLSFSGISGSPQDLVPVNEEQLDFYTPILALGTASVYVVESGTADDGLLVAVLTVIEPVYRSSIFDIRRVLPINYLLGPRNMELLQQVGTSEKYPVGLMEAVTSAIGDQDNDIGGLFQTRSTAAVSIGATSLPVEST